MGLPKEQCAESKKERLQYCCNLAWMKNSGQILWNAIAFCEMSETTPHERRVGESFKGPVIPFGGMV